MARALVHVPATAKKGEIVELKVLIQHPMETGYRAGTNGTIIPRDIIRVLVCRYDDVEVFRAELSPAIAANPFVAFTTVAVASGTISFTWTGDNGFEQTETARIEVT